MIRNALHWFEIPVADIGRAQRFYETLLAKAMRREQMGPQTLAIFAYDNGSGVGGARSRLAPRASAREWACMQEGQVLSPRLERCP